MNPLQQRRQLGISPPTILAASFAVLIGLGTLLLKLPGATTQPISWLQAAFTATSAVTVTGLGVVDTGTVFAPLGQVIIALLIQMGGLGFMTFAVLVLMRPGKRHVGIGQQLAAQEALGNTSLNRLGQTARAVVGFALGVEVLGMLLLTLCWADTLGWKQAAYHGFFHAISAFNNAGFGLYADNLSRYVGDAGTNLVITGLIMAGGLGFLVWMELGRERRWSRLSTNTRLVLLATLGLNVGGCVLFWLLEMNHTLRDLPPLTQFWASWFQAVTTRTAGFNTLPIGELEPGTSLMMMLWMFIGAGSMSTASGIKIGTMAVLLAAIWAFLRQREQVTLLRRNVPLPQVMKAMAVFGMASMTAGLGCFVLVLLEPQIGFLDLAFETVSALGTVGITRDVTGRLQPASLMVVMGLMFVGRVGTLTLAYSIMARRPSRIRYADTDIQVG